MSAGARQILAIFRVGIAPVRAPIAGVIGVGIVIPSRIVALDIGEIEDDFVICAGIVEYDVVVSDERLVGAVGMAGHEDEAHGWVFLFESVHGVQILVDRLFAVAGLLGAPGPHGEVKQVRVGNSSGTILPPLRAPVILRRDVGLRRIAVVYAKATSTAVERAGRCAACQELRHGILRVVVRQSLKARHNLRAVGCMGIMEGQFLGPF